ncbi:MAG: 50S ribosomal protein L9 [Bacteroidales bacterium]|nr:50S ribosomal protein L9 [Bacteroidales bacterium]MBR2475387.1 50S ribosomal protein L9 [Bacteroidaceae bacterium]MBR3608705.1 50S ribosomal protein L9 [Bacteroidales bacterium]MBR4118471.1 50S ribosomal protein L9 [Bacteroidales bacterium]
MQVILKEDILNLGFKGDVVNVKKGYGRNYLIPQGKAVIASESALKMLAEDNRQRAEKLAKLKADAEALATSLNGVSISIATKASETGKVFGSVTSVQIADTLAEKGFTVDRRLIALKEPLKELGAHKVVIKLYKEVSAEIEVVVVAE